MNTTKTKPNYIVGDIYEFTVNAIHYNFCELVDDSGFFVYLRHTNGLNLSKGQRVRCRVTANYQTRPKIELVDDGELESEKSKVTVDSVSKIINTPQKNWDTSKFVSLLLMNEVEDKTFENDCRQWIMSLNDNNGNLEQVRDDCTEFMEDSDFLGLCNATERDHFQQRLTTIIDYLGYLIKANNLIADGKASDFIENLLEKLEKTGYVYHPESNFNILSFIFLSDRGLMEDNIPRLFDIIRRWSIDIWNKEPFKSALLKALSLYIDENIWTVDKLGDNNGRLVRNLIQALAILVLLADNEDNHDVNLPDERIMLSRLSVISTYIDEFNNKELLSVAMSSLLSEKYYLPRYTLADTEGLSVPFALKRSPAALSSWPVQTNNCFIKDQNRLVVSKDGIAVYSDSPKAKPVIPESLGLWGNLQVYADRSMMPSLSGEITVNDSKRLWEAIERDLFTPNSLVAALIQGNDERSKHVKAVHVVGDTVNIRVVRVLEEDDNDKGDNRAYCVIEGETRESGYIYGRDIVSYMHHVSQWMFQDYNGNPLTLEAKIIEEENNGMFHFSMLEPIKEFVCSNFNPGDEVICSMGSMRRSGTTNFPSPGITKDGYSVSLTGSIGETLQRGDIVKATYMGKANGTFHIYCSIKERFDGYKVDMPRAFHNLMLNYAFVDDDAQSSKSEDDKSQVVPADFNDTDTDRMLDATYVKEIIRIVDRMAIIDADYVRSYNYLAFARVLCRMVEWNARADCYRGRMQLIEMLYDFAKNDTVNESQLDRLQNDDSELFANDTPLHDKFQQLRIISFMGNQPHDDELMKFRSTTQGLTRQMASLAIAYNILLENNLHPQANDVLNHVKSMLRLNGYESHLKTYGGGIESRTVEFKTSIVYPPANDSYPDIEKQMHTILSVIASFLNTEGGTLYIGVNDSGAGVGVYDDLCYTEFNGDHDKYQRYVLDAVALRWGNNVASYVNADWDHDPTSGKDVLIVSVEPDPVGVELDGEWLYRNGSGNRHLSKVEFEEYNQRRRAKLAEMSASSSVQPSVEHEEKESQEASPTPTANVPAVTPKAATPEVVKIKTSCLRDNVLEDYLDGFRPYEACLKFMPHGKLQKIPKYDYDEFTELTLPVYEEDVKDSYLMLGYEDGTIGKVPVREIMKFDDRKDYNRYTGSRLIFAAIATDDDGIVSVSRENKAGHRLMVRVDSISDIDPCRLPDSGARVCNEGMAERTISYEIAPAKELPDLKNLLNKDVRTLGFPLATVSSDIKSHLHGDLTSEV